MVSPGRDDPGPARVTDALDAIRREYRMPEPSELDALTDRWAALVGDALARHSQPQSLRSGVLVVLADDAAWAGQLRYLDQVLADRIAAELPEVTVREVRIATRARVAPDREKRGSEARSRPWCLVDWTRSQQASDLRFYCFPGGQSPRFPQPSAPGPSDHLTRLRKGARAWPTRRRTSRC